MTIQNKNAFKVSAWFSLISFVSTVTFVVPFVFMMPGVAIESVFKHFYPNADNKSIGLTLIVILSIILLTLLVRFYLIIKRRLRDKIPIDNEVLIINNFLFSVIIHPLGFYLYWGLSLHFRMDGQLAFAIFGTFPVTSLFFIAIGFITQEFIIDWTPAKK